MTYETASHGPGSSRRTKPAQPRAKRCNLANAIKTHQALIAKQGASELDNMALDAATAALVSEAKLQAKRAK